MENKKVVVKSNELIEASYRLTPGEQKIILKLVSEINPYDEDFKKYIFKIKDFQELIGTKHKDQYTEVKEATRELISKVLTFNTSKSTLQVGWLSSAEYIEGQGIVELEISPKLKPYLLQLKSRFTSYKLSDVIQLRSAYSLRIYELLKQYQKIGERVFDITEIRRILGIRNNEYSLYGDFKKRIILVAQRELAQKTDISFDFLEIKGNKKVIQIKFFIKPKTSYVDEKTDISTDKTSNLVEGQISIEIVSIIEKFKKTTGAELHPERVQHLISLRGYNTIHDYIDNYDKIVGDMDIDDIAGFFYAAVRDGYTIPKKSKSKITNMNNFKQRKYEDIEYDV